MIKLTTSTAYVDDAGLTPWINDCPVPAEAHTAILSDDHARILDEDGTIIASTIPGDVLGSKYEWGAGNLP